MSKIKYRLALLVASWLGIDSALDQNGKCLAIIDHHTHEPVVILHHRHVVMTIVDKVRSRIPFLKPKDDEQDEWPTHEITRPGVDDDYEPPEPDQIREVFERYGRHIEEMAASASDEDPRAERILAGQREIARALDVDLADDAVWRGVLMVAYAVTSTAHGMMSRGVMWPPPFMLSDGAAAALCRTRQSLLLEGQPPDLDFVLPDEEPDGDGRDDGSE